MTTPTEEHQSNAFDLVRNGPAHRIAGRLGLTGPPAHRRLVKVLLLLLVTWFPLALLSWAAGNAFGDGVTVTFFHDPEVHVRFLFVVPLLELAATVVSLSMIVQSRHLGEMGIVSEEQQPQMEAAKAEALAMRGSQVAEGVLVGLSYGAALVLRMGMGFSEGLSSWERMGSSLTLAGWWHTLVSLPILYFFLFRWVWVFLLWSRFLYRVSRLDLELTPTHPDRTGGLGFLGWGQASYATVLMAVSAVVSSGMVRDIMHKGESFDSLKYHVIAFVVTALIVLFAPLAAFSGRLSRCRFTGLLEFGELVWQHDRAFDEKWIRNPPDEHGEKLLGNADIQSLADVAMCYEHVDRMRLIPFDMKACVVLILAILVPLIPVLGTEIPFTEIFSKLAELMV